MAIWAIADLHLSFGVPNKQMDLFGVHWQGYTEKIEKHWRSSIGSRDLVLIPGDISWAMRVEEAVPDLQWIDRLPGIKVLIKGNHDYWWSSLSKLKGILPPSCHLIQNNSWTWGEISIAGTRLWDVPGLNFNAVVEIKEEVKKKSVFGKEASEGEKIYQRELRRLEISLKGMHRLAKKRIVMTHYPPIGPELQETEVSRLLEKYQVDVCVFGHLHHVKSGLQLFGVHHGIHYHLTACDYLEDFRPLKIHS